MRKGITGFIIFLLVFAALCGVECWAEMPEIDPDDWIGIMGEIDEDKVEGTVKVLRKLDSKRKSTPIGIRVFSSGGSLLGVLAICDTIQNLNRPVVTVGLGKALSGAALILSSGDKRYISQHSIVMLHQPSIIIEEWSSTFEGARQFSEVLSKIENQMYSLLAKNTGKTKEELKELLQTELWFTPEEAIEFGLADEVLGEERLRIKKKVLPKEKEEVPSPEYPDFPD